MDLTEIQAAKSLLMHMDSLRVQSPLLTWFQRHSTKINICLDKPVTREPYENCVEASSVFWGYTEWHCLFPRVYLHSFSKVNDKMSCICHSYWSPNEGFSNVKIFCHDKSCFKSKCIDSKSWLLIYLWSPQTFVVHIGLFDSSLPHKGLGVIFPDLPRSHFLQRPLCTEEKFFAKTPALGGDVLHLVASLLFCCRLFLPGSPRYTT